MKNKKIFLTDLNNDNQDMITRAKDSNELEAQNINFIWQKAKLGYNNNASIVKQDHTR